jgi:hypothetical protein
VRETKSLTTKPIFSKNNYDDMFELTDKGREGRTWEELQARFEIDDDEHTS